MNTPRDDFRAHSTHVAGSVRDASECIIDLDIPSTISPKLVRGIIIILHACMPTTWPIYRRRHAPRAPSAAAALHASLCYHK